VVSAVARLRALDLKKSPSIAETLDWVRALVVLGAEALDERVVQQTLDLVLKYEADVEKARGKLREIVATPG
jgi:MoxR-like ATPase